MIVHHKQVDDIRNPFSFQEEVIRKCLLNCAYKVHLNAWGAKRVKICLHILTRLASHINVYISEVN